MRSSLSALVLSSAGLHVAAKNPVSYRYLPITLEYGANSKVTANLTFGDSARAQPVKVVMDSASNGSWIWGPGAKLYWGSLDPVVEGPCHETVPTFYNPALSTTSAVTSHTSTFAYADRSLIVTGRQLVHDFITVPGSTKVIDTQFAVQTYGRLRIADNGTCNPISYDKGIIGLAPFKDKAAGTNLRRILYESGQISAQHMFMWFDKSAGISDDISGGIIFGAVDMTKFSGDMIELENVATESQVGVRLHKPLFIIQDETLNPDLNSTCLLDTSAPADTLPFVRGGKVAAEFLAGSGGKLVDHNGVIAFQGSCEEIPADFSITYSWAGLDPWEWVEVHVPVRNYARGLTDPHNARVCLLNLKFGPCVMGAPFHSAAAILMDDESGRFGLAQGGVTEKGSNLDKGILVTMRYESNVDPDSDHDSDNDSYDDELKFHDVF